MKLCVSMMPVEGDNNPARHSTSGSSFADFLGAERSEIMHPVGICLAFICTEFLYLSFICRDNDLAGFPERDIFFVAIFIELLATGNTQPGLQRICWIVDAGVDDFGVAAAGMHCQRRFSLHHEHLEAGECETTRDGNADHTAADDQALEFLCHELPDDSLCRLNSHEHYRCQE